VEILDEADWTARRAAHEHRVDQWLAPHLARRRGRVDHPVEDFLFTYYSHRPGALRRWHPGFGTALTGASEHGSLPGYEVVATGEGPVLARVAEAYLAGRVPRIRQVRDLLAATASRPPQLGCFGMHEWAMVYGQQEVRHAAWPLRLGRDGTDRVVERHRISCSHFDAFRFFTPAARPLNALRPGPADRAAFEQPGCLHAGMDLYKHAFRLSPLVGSELVADCFELARDIRVLDMRASPYDLTGLGYAPLAVETTAGKQEYVEAQRGFAARGAPLRRRLVEECDRLLAAVPA
jgi:hypothetical protein